MYEFLAHLVLFLKWGKRDSCPSLLAVENTTYHRHTFINQHKGAHCWHDTAHTPRHLPWWLTLFGPQRDTVELLLLRTNGQWPNAIKAFGQCHCWHQRWAVLWNMGNARWQEHWRQISWLVKSFLSDSKINYHFLLWLSFPFLAPLQIPIGGSRYTEELAGYSPELQMVAGKPFAILDTVLLLNFCIYRDKCTISDHDIDSLFEHNY